MLPIQPIDMIIIALYVFFGLILGYICLELLKKGTWIVGEPPINLYLFLFGKISMFLCMGAAFIQSVGINLRIFPVPGIIQIIALIVLVFGFLFINLSLINLGTSTKMGFPKEKTKLETKGLYKLSRNPMYISFFTLCIGSILYTLNPIILVLGIFGIYTHHKTTLSEEKFLVKRFGKDYIKYSKKVKRYL